MTEPARLRRFKVVLQSPLVKDERTVTSPTAWAAAVHVLYDAALPENTDLIKLEVSEVRDADPRS